MRKAAAPPPPPSGFQNGHGSVSTDDSDSLSGESLEGNMELTVELPIGKNVRMSVEKRTAMMDLLIQVAKANGLNPASYVLDARNENTRNSILFKPNTPIGSLTTSTVYVIPKSSIRDPSGRQNMKSGSQPFEKTFRLRVLLPRNQLFVQRVSQNTPLIDIFHTICSERELNPSKYEFRHPVHTEERLDLQRCLSDYGLAEVAMVAVKGSNGAFSRSSSDIMALQQEDDRKKSRLFGFMYRKSKSASKSLGSDIASSDGHSSRGVSPARSDESGRNSVSPPSSTAGFTYVNGASKLSTKKRMAPVPPQLNNPRYMAPASRPPMSESSNGIATTSSHSRHSSDSSGYHEASILSESPETTKDLECIQGSKTSAVPSKRVASVSTLTSVDSSTSLSSVSSGLKKKKAPAPPPPRSVDATFAFCRVPLKERSSAIQENEVREVKRQDSESSQASSISEKSPIASPTLNVAPIPVPLPRSSKSPADTKPITNELDENGLSKSFNESDSETTLQLVEDDNDGLDETIRGDVSNAQLLIRTNSVKSDVDDGDDIEVHLNHEKHVDPEEAAASVEEPSNSVLSDSQMPPVIGSSITNGHEDRSEESLEKVDDGFSDNADSLSSSPTLSRRNSEENKNEYGLPPDFESRMTASHAYQEVDIDNYEGLNENEENTIKESEMFSLGEPDNFEANADLPSIDEASQPTEMNGLNLSTRSSVSSSSDKSDELRTVEESNATTPPIDDSFSDHKITAEIEEAFASIDLMESASDQSDLNSHLESRESSPDEVIKWEHNQTSEPSNPDSSVIKNKEAPVAKLAKDTVNLPTKYCTNELQSTNANLASQVILQETSQIRNTTQSNGATERVTNSDTNYRRITYQKPVVNFSISSYKSRVEDDDGYQHRTVKTLDSVKPPETTTASQNSNSRIEIPTTITSNSVNRSAPKQDFVPGQASSITKAIGSKTGAEPSNNSSTNELHDVFNRLRKSKSEVAIGNQDGANLQTPSSEQDKLQQEYVKLHQQFLHWHQQLLQNQTVLQQQNILPESSSETLQRLQELNQQFFSLPSQKQQAKSSDGMSVDQSDYMKKTQSLPRPKSMALPSEDIKTCDLRKAPSFGSRSWRPVTMSVWNQRSQKDKEPKIEIEEAEQPKNRSRTSPPSKGVQQTCEATSQEENRPVSKVESKLENRDATQPKDKSSQMTASVEIIPKETTRSVSVKESVSVFNLANNNDRPAKFSRPVSQVNMFPKCPVVKGFSLEPQKTSKILITTSKKPNINEPASSAAQGLPISAPQVSKPSTVRVNIGANVKQPTSNVTTNGVSSKPRSNATEFFYPTSKNVPFVERSNKPLVQTKTYFGDRIESQANSSQNNNNSETTAVQKIARTVSLKTPVNYNYSSPMYSSNDKDNNIRRRQNSDIPSPPPPPPPPPAELSTDTVFRNNGTGVSKDIKRPATSRTASSSSNEDFKNELMMAIRDFGGRSGLRKVSSAESDWQNRYGKLN